MITSADESDNEDEQKMLEKMLSSVKTSLANIRNAITLLQSHVVKTVGEFDARKDQLNVANGVLHLRTGVLEPHGPQHTFTYCITVRYVPGARSQEWFDFLNSSLKVEEGVVDFVQQAVGYTLTGETREEKLFFLAGPERAGKGTFCETLLALLGEPLSSGAEFALFAESRQHDANNFALAALKPTRFIVASEGEKGKQLDAATVKHLTGGDSVMCCEKFKPHFSYRPGFKLWLLSNHDVRVDVDDPAAWGRVVRIPFPHSFKVNPDKTLKERLKRPENLVGILAWAVEGAIQWYASPTGLPVPPCWHQALQEVRLEQDIVQQWIDDRTVDDAGMTDSSVLYEDYKAWCHEHSYVARKQKGFGTALRSKGYTNGRFYTTTTKQVHGWAGLTLTCLAGYAETGSDSTMDMPADLEAVAV